ncbi:MAG TPA: ABC transporter ATP-binding protein [Spirochaetota bacterium]|nr:ABC transporter ATP-binding protein [Spirochaetota bacterium]HRZ28527.1 ABC transporter ATP-binding protein [Spirochaetota bacterium]HSA15080.1 ABC transporter ATP-binding protein [Spirochaetota bacterium]
MSIIAIKALVKDYDVNGIAVNAVRGIDMTIDKGEFTAIAGPSGSGKTTLLNIVGGLDYPTSGSVVVGDRDLSGMSSSELSDMRLNNIGFIFQAYNLIPVLSALENVEYILLLQGVSKKERQDRAREILIEVGLEKEISRLPKDMSGGQQQRVAVARAIVSEPEIILADEPTANLDQKTGANLLDLMHELNRKKNITFLFSTHDSMVMERAERLIQLSDGMIASDEKRR